MRRDRWDSDVGRSGHLAQSSRETESGPGTSTVAEALNPGGTAAGTSAVVWMEE